MQSTPTRLRILIVDDESNIRITLSLCLEALGHQVTAVGTAAESLAAMNQQGFDVIFLDLRLGTANGMDLIPPFLRSNPWVRIVVITAYASIDSAVEAMKRGAYDYLPKPFTPAQVEAITQKAAEVRNLELKVHALEEMVDHTSPVPDFSTTSPLMQRAISHAQLAAKSSATILLCGEVGTGKSVLARAIHLWSPRASGSIGFFSCAGKSAEALERELFGNAGAAADAPSATTGRIASVEGGTLIIDDVDLAPLEFQTRLLNLIHDRQYERQDDYTPRNCDVRVIATTTCDLAKALATGKFRSDLFHALQSLQIDLSPLRDRPEDILTLARHFLAFCNYQSHRSVGEFSEEVSALLKSYAWPGNLRELRNLVERSVILCTGHQIGLEHLPPNLVEFSSHIKIGDLVALDKIEETHIRSVLASAGSLESAASILGIDVTTLWRRRQRYGL